MNSGTWQTSAVQRVYFSKNNFERKTPPIGFDASLAARIGAHEHLDHPAVPASGRAGACGRAGFDRLVVFTIYRDKGLAVIPACVRPPPRTDGYCAKPC